MEEVYTCQCGGQAWVIGESKVTCAKCGTIYEVACILPPEYFNKELDDRRRTT